MMGDNSFTPGPTPNIVRAADGRVLILPEGWFLLPSGVAALTCRVKLVGDHRSVAGTGRFSHGLTTRTVS